MVFLLGYAFMDIFSLDLLTYQRVFYLQIFKQSLLIIVYSLADTKIILQIKFEVKSKVKVVKLLNN